MVLLKKADLLWKREMSFTLCQEGFTQISTFLAQWFLRRRFFNDPTLFLPFLDYLPLGGGEALHLNNLECPLPKDALCQVWLKLAQWFLRRSRKVKSLQTDRQTDRRTDDGQWVIRKAHLSLQLRWAKNQGGDNPINMCIIYDLWTPPAPEPLTLGPWISQFW